MHHDDDLDTWLREKRQAVGGRVLAVRHERNLTQQALGEQAGLDRRTIGKIERGLVAADVDQLHRLAKALHVPAFTFFWG